MQEKMYKRLKLKKISKKIDLSHNFIMTIILIRQYKAILPIKCQNCICDSSNLNYKQKIVYLQTNNK